MQTRAERSLTGTRAGAGVDLEVVAIGRSMMERRCAEAGLRKKGIAGGKQHEARGNLA
ncbi:hypothetical protein KSP40_PGU000550 [Platanthera guangdongensis]|uniref:Arginase n=1 Tax=Platanthera guangdongensis TaxID=2320717 RepID=A0ABR2LDT1_9ASPA